MRPNVAPLTVLLLAAMPTAITAQTVNVQSLLDEGYTVAAVNTSMAGGGGVYLLKGKVLVYCYVTETPGSASVDTQYCKVVK